MGFAGTVHAKGRVVRLCRLRRRPAAAGCSTRQRQRVVVATRAAAGRLMPAGKRFQNVACQRKGNALSGATHLTATHMGCRCRGLNPAQTPEVEAGPLASCDDRSPAAPAAPTPHGNLTLHGHSSCARPAPRCALQAAGVHEISTHQPPHTGAGQRAVPCAAAHPNVRSGNPGFAATQCLEASRVARFC